MMEKQHDADKLAAIAGRNPVLEALKSGREIDTLFVAKGEKTGSMVQILALAGRKGVVVKEADPRKLETLSAGAAHQGIVAVLAAAAYATVEQMLALAQQRGEAPFLVIADGIEDPHNLGALIRSAEAAGAHGLIIPKRRSSSLSPIVAKTSAGAVNHLMVARVANLSSTIELLQKRSIWVYGTDMEGAPWCTVDYTGGVALVVGSEGKGMSRLVQSKCDFIVSLPMYGKINSLNASVAGGIVLYEIARQRADIAAVNRR